MTQAEVTMNNNNLLKDSLVKLLQKGETATSTSDSTPCWAYESDSKPTV